MVTSTARPTTEQIYRNLRERIILLELAPGSRLREERLAQHFGVSRTPIREVLHRLEFEGMVEQVPGAGARVSPLDMKSLRDVWAVRLRIATVVGDFVRTPAPPAIIAGLEEIRSELMIIRETGDVQALGALYNRFHELLLGVVDNTALTKIHDLLYIQTARVWMQFLSEMDIVSEVDVMAEEVDQTIEALCGDSGAWFAEIRVKHMQMLLDRFNQHLTRPIG